MKTTYLHVVDIAPSSRLGIFRKADDGSLVEELIGFAEDTATFSYFIEEPIELVLRIRKVGLLPFEKIIYLQPGEAKTVRAEQIEDKLYGAHGASEAR